MLSLKDGLSIAGAIGRQMSLLGSKFLDNQPVNVNLDKYAFINIKGSNCVFKICSITSNTVAFLNRVSELFISAQKIALLHSFFQFSNGYFKLGYSMTNPDSILKRKDITLLTKVSVVKAVVFPVGRYGCESWTIKKAEHQTFDAFELWRWRVFLRTDSKEIKPVNPKGNQHWICIERTDAEAPILWPPDMMSWHIGKDPHAGKGWGKEEKGAIKDEMLWWYHWLNRHEFKLTP